MFDATIQTPELEKPRIVSAELRVEIVRKSIHVLIALVPLMAQTVGTGFTFALLGCGALVYGYAESLRLAGREVVLVSRITAAAAREKDKGRFILGPISLALGAMFALYFYPNPASSIAIYALAFGDGISSLAGKILGGRLFPPAGQKSMEGSLACLAVVFAATVRITGRVGASLAIALTATVLEALPTGDLDNVIIPAGTGLMAVLLL